MNSKILDLRGDAERNNFYNANRDEWDTHVDTATYLQQRLNARVQALRAQSEDAYNSIAADVEGALSTDPSTIVPDPLTSVESGGGIRTAPEEGGGVIGPGGVGGYGGEFSGGGRGPRGEEGEGGGGGGGKFGMWDDFRLTTFSGDCP